jgi:hypothetical protein
MESCNFAHTSLRTVREHIVTINAPPDFFPRHFKHVAGIDALGPAAAAAAPEIKSSSFFFLSVAGKQLESV